MKGLVAVIAIALFTQPCSARTAIPTNTLIGQAPIGWHTLRRSLATLLISNGENVEVAQSQLRHTTPKIILELYAQAIFRRPAESTQEVVQMGLPAKFREKLKARSAAPTA